MKHFFAVFDSVPKRRMLIMASICGIAVMLLTVISIRPYVWRQIPPAKTLTSKQNAGTYWFMLERKSNRETLYKGIPGDKQKSQVIKSFSVKTGMPRERPTPLPQLVGREYWKIVKKEVTDNPNTAPYFLTLDVPVSEEEPFGPVPYRECNGQCNWVTYGNFGLHGVNGQPEKLASADPGSSGCIRHTDEDITYLYQLLDPTKEEIRYYIVDI